MPTQIWMHIAVKIDEEGMDFFPWLETAHMLRCSDGWIKICVCDCARQMLSHGRGRHFHMARNKLRESPNRCGHERHSLTDSDGEKWNRLFVPRCHSLPPEWEGRYISLSFSGLLQWIPMKWDTRRDLLSTMVSAAYEAKHQPSHIANELRK